jgi:dipeptidyl aminopeptidase/acylaminoacyl peptidase
VLAVRNEVVAFSASPEAQPAVPALLVSGPDFVAAPRVSLDGHRLAWLSWNHPDMPWDSTELWVGDLVGAGSEAKVVGAQRIAGGPGESLVQPEWGPDGSLYVVSDCSDWWNVYLVAGVDDLHPVHAVSTEIARPAWVFGQSRYVVSGTGTVWMTYNDADGCHLLGVGPDHSIKDVPVDAVGLLQLRWNDGGVVAILSSFVREPVVASIAVDPDEEVDTGAVTVLYNPRTLALDPAGISVPRHVSFPTSGGRTAHAWYYPPTGVLNAEPIAGLDGERPPLITMIHGGPTAATNPAFSLAVQYGRAYRRQLDLAWGIVDVDDACAAANWLAEQGLADGERLAITGGSAGGFTTLAALATRDTFKAGASHFGVADLGALARDTHKFESRYLDGLVGPWPEAEAVYTERSPLSHIDGFDRPLIVLQGLEDEVVPPAQAQMIVDALQAKGVPYAYVTFSGEQHGFRQAPNIIRALTAELYFYSRVFGFALAENVEPVEIAFAERLTG